MIRSRLIFIFLILAYLSVTPAGIYTCACLVPVQSTAVQVNVGEISEQVSATDTAVAALLSFFSLSFAMAMLSLLNLRPKQDRRFSFLWLTPTLFCQPPPTPPPHFS